MSENYNENGYTLKDIENCIKYVDDDKIPVDYVEIILDALEFYKETHYIG